ncbi:hypothetical protein [Mycolicibacterium pulveris]|uniref:hypothetical protein n=1 Tax=Mycolicibacterium pulveris TaxID=36813 RepID=UPI003CF13C81
MNLGDRFPEIARIPRDPDLDEVDNERASNYLRAAFVESVQPFSHGARVDAFANIRLSGRVFQDGVFERHAADIFIRFQNEIDAVTDDEYRESVQMGFRQLGPGSVIMHLRPVPSVPASDDQLAVSVPPQLEVALQRVLDLHDAFEKDDVELVQRRTTASLAARVRQLIESLDAAEAGIEVDLSRSDGSRRQSSISAVGRANARRFFERIPTVSIEVLDGYLRTVSTLGKVELSKGQRVHEIIDVPADIAKALEWDKVIRVRVRQTVNAAKAGRSRKIENEFVEIVPHEDPLPGVEIE